MKIFDRYSLHPTGGPFRAKRDRECEPRLGHAPPVTAPMPPSLWRRLRLFEVHDHQRLGRAVARGDADAVRRALRDPRCNPDASLPHHPPPIVMAVDTRPTLVHEDGHLGVSFKPGGLDVLTALLADHRVNVNQRAPSSGETALELAAARDHGEAARLLIDAGAGADPLPSGWSLLGDAAQAKRNDAARALLSAPEMKADRIEPDDRSALTIAAENGNVVLLQAMLEQPGVPLHARDGRGLNALDAAVRAGKVEAVDLLLKFGADPDDADAQGHTAPWHAVDAGNVAVLRTLLKASRQPQDGGLKALAHAIFKEHHASVIALIADPRIDLEQRLDTGLTVIDLAALAVDPAIRIVLEPAMVFVRRHDGAEIAARLRDHPPERPGLLMALGAMGDLRKIDALTGEDGLQPDLEKVVEAAVRRGFWKNAAALVQGVALARWQPDGGLLCKAFGARGLTENNRTARRTVADHAGSANLAALRGKDGPTHSRAWQQDLPSLPARLAALIVACSADPELGVSDLPDTLTSLFKLPHVPAQARARVAGQALNALQRLNGTGVTLDGRALEYGPTTGDFRFKTAREGSSALREAVPSLLIRRLEEHRTAK